jgi:hypothetical protein
MNTPGPYSFAITRGKDFERKFVFKSQATGEPMPLTGLKARAQFRSLAGQFGTTTSTTLLLELADGDGIEVTDADAGEVTLTLTVANTLTLCPANTKTKVAWEFELYDDGVSPEAVRGGLIGKVTIHPETLR